MTEISQRITEVRDLATTLWFLPPPGRRMIADKLHGLGVRVHPELATMMLEREGPKELGNHAPQRVINKTSVNEDLDNLRKINPALAAQIDAARTDPVMQAKIAAAETFEERDVIAKAMGINNVAEDLKRVQETPLPPPPKPGE